MVAGATVVVVVAGVDETTTVLVEVAASMLSSIKI